MTEDDDLNKKVDKTYRWLFGQGADGDEPMAKRLAAMVKKHEARNDLIRNSIRALFAFFSLIAGVLLLPRAVALVKSLGSALIEWFTG